MAHPEQNGARRNVTGWLRTHRGLAEFGLVALCLLIYYLIRGGVVNRPAAAFQHAGDVIDLERGGGFFWEPGWQRAIGGSVFWKTFWNDVYFWLHAPVIAGIALWLYFRHHQTYTLIRNAFLISCLIGLLVYAAYPVAPPRLMTSAGYQEYGVQMPRSDRYSFEDTMREYSNLNYQAESLKPFVNPFAAVPSLHFGWAFLIGLAVLLARRTWFGWLVAVGLPVLMFFGVVLTANHFIFDAITGLAAVLGALAASVALARAPATVHRRFLPELLREFLGLESDHERPEPALERPLR